MWGWYQLRVWHGGHGTMGPYAVAQHAEFRWEKMSCPSIWDIVWMSH